LLLSFFFFLSFVFFLLPSSSSSSSSSFSFIFSLVIIGFLAGVHYFRYLATRRLGFGIGLDGIGIGKSTYKKIPLIAPLDHFS